MELEKLRWLNLWRKPRVCVVGSNSSLPGFNYVKTPPLELQSVRSFFDDPKTELAVNKAFYSVCNYLASLEAIKYVLLTLPNYRGPSIFDRFHYSTLCYAIGSQLTVGEIQKLPEEYWKWPEVEPNVSKLILRIWQSHI